MLPHNRFLIFLCFLTFLTCSKGGGEINISLDLTAAAGVSANIENFIFIVSGSNSENTPNTRLFPAECIGCKLAETPCKAENTCFVTTACGFSLNQSSFRVQVGFLEFSEGQDMTITACAQDSTFAFIASGTATVANEDKNTITIPLSPSNICTNTFPESC